MAGTVDARGLSRPQSVILTRLAITTNEFPVEVLVETATSRENVRRAERKLGCRVAVEKMMGDFKLTLVK